MRFAGFVLCTLLFTSAVAYEIPRVAPVGEPTTYKVVAGEALSLQVFKPMGWSAADRRPALVFFHGGGWVQGQPAQLARQCHYLASRGLVAITVQYRLMPKATYRPGELPLVCIADAKSAFRWVRAHAAQLGIDHARLGAGGGSAGGYLAAMLGLVPGFDDPADDHAVPLAPAALVLFNPALGYRVGDPVDAGMAERQEERLGEFLRHSPANHVGAGAPPTIIHHGDQDTAIPPAQIRRFAELMRTAGVRCEAIFYPGQGHSFFNYDKAGGRNFVETMIATDRFLASLGWLAGEPTLTLPAPR